MANRIKNLLESQSTSANGDQAQERSYKALIVGHNLPALLTWYDLSQAYRPGEFALVSLYPLEQENPFELNEFFLRGEKNVEVLQSAYADLQIETESQASVFYRDQQFKLFGGKAKSEPLKPLEEYFIAPRSRLNLDELLPMSWEVLMKQIEQTRLALQIHSLDRTATGWRLNATDGQIINCEELFFAEAPFEWLQKFSGKNQLSPEIHQYCQNTQGNRLLIIAGDLSEKLTERTETLFIPQSQTHEWGHFMGHFEDLSSSIQRYFFVTFLSEDQNTPEELSKKIKLFKRNLRRVFPAYTKAAVRERYFVSHRNPCLKLEDSSWEFEAQELRNLHLIGPDAPLRLNQLPPTSFEYSSDEVVGLTRALLSYQQVKNNFQAQKRLHNG